MRSQNRIYNANPISEFNLPIVELAFPWPLDTHVYELLKSNKINTVYDVAYVQKGRDWYAMRGMGPKRFAELYRLMDATGHLPQIPGKWRKEVLKAVKQLGPLSDTAVEAIRHFIFPLVVGIDWGIDIVEVEEAI